MKIIAVERRRRSLYRLSFEESDPIEVDVRTFDESPYKEGAVITAEQLQALLATSQYNRARERALYFLGLRDYACKELEQKLRDAAMGGGMAIATESEDDGADSDE